MTGEVGKKLIAHFLKVIRSQNEIRGCAVCAHTSSQLCTRHSPSGKEAGVFCSEMSPAILVITSVGTGRSELQVFTTQPC